MTERKTDIRKLKIMELVYVGFLILLVSPLLLASYYLVKLLKIMIEDWLEEAENRKELHRHLVMIFSIELIPLITVLFYGG